jgi:peptidoglycan/xylan/chitin deacetylase (PgdA/CDA1 family)
MGKGGSHRRRGRGVAFLAGVLLLALAAVLVVQPLAAFALLEAAFPGILWRVQTSQPLVALSFDDGPDPIHTPPVLEILERHGARATFFLIAERALQRPDLVARIRAEGHEVANHYVTRRSALRDGDAAFLEKLKSADRVLGLDFSRPRLFRPPGGIARPGQLDLARRHGHTVVLGSAYPFDPLPPPVSYIRWLVTGNLAPGVIVILHDGIEDPSRSIEALPHILESGARRGLRFVSVGELMRAPGAGSR